MRDIINNDICDNKITDIVGDDIYYYYKPEEVESKLYIEWQFISQTRGNYSGNIYNTKDALIQINIYSDISELDKYYKLEKIIPELLDGKDYRYNNEIELYENDTGLWHKAFRYYKTIQDRKDDLNG